MSRNGLRTSIAVAALGVAGAVLGGCGVEPAVPVGSRSAALIYQEQALLVDAQGVSNDHFGHAVAVSGDTALVGIHGANAPSSDSGAAQVYTRSAGVWTLQQQLTAYDGGTMDYYGTSVALSGDTAVVGAPWWGSTGAVYIYVRSGNTWALQQKLTPANGAQFSDFGHAVAIDGDMVAIGAETADDPVGCSNCGAVHVYTRSGSTWSLLSKLVASGASADDMLGSSVAVAGTTVLAGAPNDDDLGADAGAAYAFRYSGGQWSESKLTASDGGTGDKFGHAVSAEGSTLLIGSPFDDDRGTDAGAAYVFGASGNGYVQAQKITASDGAAGDQFGYAVGLSATGAIVGAHFDDDLGSTAGAAYLYTGGLLSEIEKRHASNGAASHLFGGAVAIDGDTAVIGADGADSGKGRVYIEYATDLCTTYVRTAAQPTLFADSYIASDFTDPTKALSNYGAATSLHAGLAGTNLRSGLLRFDGSSLPAGATITQAQLLLRKATSIGTGTVTVHAVTAPWSESTVTWNSLANAYDPAPLLSFQPSLTLTGTDVTLDLLGQPLAALIGDGLLLNEPSSGRVQVGASEAPALPSRPRLLICAH